MAALIALIVILAFVIKKRYKNSYSTAGNGTPAGCNNQPVIGEFNDFIVWHTYTYILKCIIYVAGIENRIYSDIEMKINDSKDIELYYEDPHTGSDASPYQVPMKSRTMSSVPSTNTNEYSPLHSATLPTSMRPAFYEGMVITLYFYSIGPRKTI